MTDETPTPAAGSAQGKLIRTLVFVAVIGGVVGLFAYLSSLEHPPDLPSDATHRFRFNTKGELVGLAIEQQDPSADAVEHAGVELDLKAIEQQVNNVCQSCHGAPGVDLSQHPCREGGRCVPLQHPPKNTCIKCHRHAQ